MSELLKDATARPWAWVKSDHYGYSVLWNPEQGLEVITTGGINDGDDPITWMGEDMTDANARLIVTAVNAYEPMLAACASLFDAIAHGDEDHRDWLKEAIDDHFAGRPVERPRGKGAGAIDDLDEPEIEDAWELWWSEFYDAVEKEQTDSFDIGDLQLAYSRAYQAGHASAIALAKGETS